MTDFEREDEEVFAIVRANKTRKVDLSEQEITLTLEGGRPRVRLA